jgi:hypothetical protein
MEETRMKKTINEIKSKISEVLPQPEQAQALSDFIDSRIHQLGDLFRAEMKQSYEQYRVEMAKVHEQQRQQLQRQSLYQWLITVAFVLGVLAKWVSNHL